MNIRQVGVTVLLSTVAAAAFSVRLAPQALAQPGGPVLSVGAPQLKPGGWVDVPVTFRAHGNAVATVLFSLDIDTTRVSFDPADKDGDDLPDAIHVGVPAVFRPMISLAPNGAGGKLNVLITGMQAPLPALPDSTLVTLTLRTKSDKPAELARAVVFAAQPAPSFGGTRGQSVTGTAVDARSAATPSAAAAAGSTPGAQPPGGVAAAPTAAGNPISGPTPLAGLPGGGSPAGDNGPAARGTSSEAGALAGGAGSAATSASAAGPGAPSAGIIVPAGNDARQASGAAAESPTATGAPGQMAAALPGPSGSGGGVPAASGGDSSAGVPPANVPNSGRLDSAPVDGSGTSPQSPATDSRQARGDEVLGSGLGRWLASCAILAIIAAWWVRRRRHAAE